jgi:hypothetical protein
MGFLAFPKGLTHFWGVRLAMTSSTIAYPRGSLAVEVVIQRLQQALPRALTIAQPGRSTFRILACSQHTNQYVVPIRSLKRNLSRSIALRFFVGIYHWNSVVW